MLSSGMRGLGAQHLVPLYDQYQVLRGQGGWGVQEPALAGRGSPSRDGAGPAFLCLAEEEAPVFKRDPPGPCRATCAHLHPPLAHPPSSAPSPQTALGRVWQSKAREGAPAPPQAIADLTLGRLLKEYTEAKHSEISLLLQSGPGALARRGAAAEPSQGKAARPREGGPGGSR